MKTTFKALSIILFLFTTTLAKAENWSERGKSWPLPDELQVDKQYFGHAISIDSNYLVVGSPGYLSKGKVEVFKYVDSNWVRKAELSPSEGSNSAGFSYSVSISGNTIIVGAYSGGGGTGIAYVYTMPAEGWGNMTENAILSPSDGTSGNGFGWSVEMDQEVIVVGSYKNVANGTPSGAAYVYEKPSNGWVNMTESAKLIPSDGYAYDHFGSDVDISDDDIIIAADYKAGRTGAAYVYSKPITGWVDTVETVKLNIGSKGSRFGISVGIHNDEIVVGADGSGLDGTRKGYAYIYTKPTTGWEDATITAVLRHNAQQVYDGFGQSLSVFKNKIVIGAGGVDGKQNGEGLAYIYEKPDSGGWTSMAETHKLSASDPLYGNSFGYAVVATERNIIVTSYGDDTNGSNAGAIYAFSKPSKWMDRYY